MNSKWASDADSLERMFIGLQVRNGMEDLPSGRSTGWPGTVCGTNARGRPLWPWKEKHGNHKGKVYMREGRVQ